MNVVALERHRAIRRVRIPSHQPGKCRLASARRTDDGGEHTGARRQRDAVQQCLVAIDGPGHPAHVEAADAGLQQVLFTARQGAVGEDEVDVADGHDVAVVQQRRVDPGAVDEGAIDAAVVPNLRAARRRDQGGVVT
ncbi:Uncharacterised protein [Mycobacterium tuberculosis]|nr:Uncharacterised protein [Mycobacterium tuberculosis]CKT46748.1 Uncharacterised protein [Mycobacterium tuberculosis]